MTLAEINALDQSAFVDTLGWVFEHSPWVAERAWPGRPFTSADALHETMAAVVAAATPDEQLSLLRAHPDLGARARMTAASTDEQRSAGVDALSPGDAERLQQLNASYSEKFAFPFLFAVKGSTPPQILAALESRLGAAYAAELAEALRQVARIARFRLDGLITS